MNQTKLNARKQSLKYNKINALKWWSLINTLDQLHLINNDQCIKIYVIKQKLQSLKQILLYFLICPVLDKIKFEFKSMFLQKQRKICHSKDRQKRYFRIWKNSYKIKLHLGKKCLI